MQGVAPGLSCSDQVSLATQHEKFNVQKSSPLSLLDQRQRRWVPDAPVVASVGVNATAGLLLVRDLDKSQDALRDVCYTLRAPTQDRSTRLGLDTWEGMQEPRTSYPVSPSAFRARLGTPPEGSRAYVSNKRPSPYSSNHLPHTPRLHSRSSSDIGRVSHIVHVRCGAR